ncbi:MAG TPA: dockerin type I domain-containing protein, partial [Armatimonadota bacterium]
EFSDPNANHLALHSTRATKEPLNERSALGLTAAIPALADGAEHTVRLHYFPGTLTVFMDDMQRPVMRVPVNLEEELLLEDGLAWVGFTASNASGKQMQFIESWLFDADTSALPPLGLMGDVNGDGKLDAVDASVLLEAILGLQVLGQPSATLADVDHSGAIDLKDLRGVLSTAAWAASR